MCMIMLSTQHWPRLKKALCLLKKCLKRTKSTTTETKWQWTTGGMNVCSVQLQCEGSVLGNHTGGGGAMSLDQRRYWYCMVQVIAVGNLRCSSFYEAPGSLSAQPAHPADLRPACPSLTT